MFVTNTGPVCGRDAGDRHSTAVDDTHRPGTTGDAVVLPNLQRRCTESTKWAPVTVTSVLPDSGPFTGLTDLTRTGGTYSNSAPSIVKSTPLVVTSSATTPVVGEAGALHDASVAETNVALAGGSLPKRQSVSDESRKLLPVTLTTVPPMRLPVRGMTEMTLGAST